VQRIVRILLSNRTEHIFCCSDRFFAHVIVSRRWTKLNERLSINDMSDNRRISNKSFCTSERNVSRASSSFRPSFSCSECSLAVWVWALDLSDVVISDFWSHPQTSLSEKQNEYLVVHARNGLGVEGKE
jgi:hypothetical protein